MKTLVIFVLLIAFIPTASLVSPYVQTRQGASSFSLQGYYSEESLLRALQARFPEGTDRNSIENVLSSNSNLAAHYANAEQGSYFIAYSEENKDVGTYFELGGPLVFQIVGLRQVRFKFNKQNRLVAIDAQILRDAGDIKFFIGERINGDKR
jgi:hypothetical protein